VSVRVRPVIQLTQTECALACALMVLRTLGVNESMANLRKDFDVGRDGMSMPQIVRVLKSRGLGVKMYRANADGLRSLHGPVIAYWEDYHFVVVERFVGSRVVICDPAQGRRTIRVEEFESSFSGVALAVTPGGGERFQPPPQFSAWRYFVRPLLETKSAIVGLFVLSLITYAATLAVPRLTQGLIDGTTPGWLDIRNAWLWGGILLVALAYFAMLSLRVVATNIVTLAIGSRSMESIYHHLLRLPYKYFGSRSPGELAFRLNSVSAIRDMITGQLVSGVVDSGLVVALLIYMAVTSWQLTVVAAVLVLIVASLLVISRQRVADSIDQSMTETAKSQALEMESIASIAALKIAGIEMEFFGRWRIVFRRSLARLNRSLLLQGLVSNAVTVAQIAAPVLVLLVGLGLVRGGVLTLGAVIGFQLVASTLFSLSSTLFGAFSQYQVARSYIERIADITEWVPEDLDRGGISEFTRGDIHVENVTFAYSDQSEPVLTGVSLDVHKGEKVAIVGRSGSGKSTLGKLLAGLYEASSGSVRYDNNLISAYDRERFYRHIAMVPQDIALQNRSIEDNIRMGDEDLPFERVVDAAIAARIHDQITDMPMGYKTLVSELGANLSGGQRQRVALARALAKEPKVLILDEATSSLDMESEEAIFAHLDRQSYTRIVIAHRLSTISDADVIIVMDSGQIVQRGTHDQLLNLEGVYRNLYRSQVLQGDLSATS